MRLVGLMQAIVVQYLIERRGMLLGKRESIVGRGLRTECGNKG